MAHTMIVQLLQGSVVEDNPPGPPAAARPEEAAVGKVAERPAPALQPANAKRTSAEVSNAKRACGLWWFTYQV